jgi:hypothetical protein
MHVRDAEEMVSHCLLKLALAWEAFVEEAFLKYMCGAPSAAARRPTLINAHQTSTAAAYTTLLGSNRYLSWSRLELDQRAKQHFAGGVPFSPTAAAAATTLDELVAVRNRIAHRSEYAKEKFRTVVRDQLSYFPRGMTPGRFLMIRTPSGKTTFENYAGTLVAAAQLISHH